MQCPQCGAENIEGAKFCFNCGSKLAAICPQCGAALPPKANFCIACGANVGLSSVGARLQPEAALAGALQRLVPREYAERLLATRGQVRRERRTVTILFSDVQGSTSLAGRLDPEEWTEIMEGAFAVLIEPIYRYEGTLGSLLGDAILAFFGAPIAHEDDPERACRAALEIIEGAQQYAKRLEEQRGISGFSVRVGVNTGMVVVGEVGSDLRVEYTAMGDAVNLAERIQSAAGPGTVLLTEATHKLVSPLFETEALGPIQVKGKVEPVAAYRVLGAGVVSDKPRGISGLESSLVGRGAEFGALAEVLACLQAGLGGIVTVVGDAGIGKSRLVAELHKQADPDLQWVEGRCLSYGTSVAYLLWLDVLRGLLEATAEDSPAVVRDALAGRAQTLCPDRAEEVVPYLGRLLSLPLTSREEILLQNLASQRLKAATFEAVETLVECAARDHPLVVVCEDLHWADPTSMELLERLLALTDRAALLLICVFRPETDHDAWRLRETAVRDYLHRHTDLWLDPLTAAESERLVANLLGMEGLPQKLKWRILGPAEGNPFCVEEIIRSLIASEAIVRDEATGHWKASRDVSAIAIPDTLQGVLMARLDRLPEGAKRALQMASVIGRIFRYRVLLAIAEAERAQSEPWSERILEGSDPTQLRKELDEYLVILQREGMLRQRARVPEPEYIFKHVLTQEAAYNSLLKNDRSTFHRRVAEALEGLFPDHVDEQVELLAYHWERAGDLQRAVDYLSRAGGRAVHLSANEEAIVHFTRALDLLRALPKTSERTRQELGLQIDLGVPLLATKGYAAAEVGQAFALAEELCRQVGDTDELFAVLRGQWEYYEVRTELQAAHDLAQQLLHLAEGAGDPALLLEAHRALGSTLSWMGEPALALDHLDRAISLYYPQEHHAHAFRYGNDPAVTCQRHAANALWHLGYPDQALERSQEALTLARKLSHPHSLAGALVCASWLHQRRGEEQVAYDLALEAIVLCDQQGFALWQAFALGPLGWALARQGAIDEGIRRINRSLSALRATGTEVVWPYCLILLAETYVSIGRAGERLAAADEMSSGKDGSLAPASDVQAAVTEALAAVDRSGQRCWEADLNRLKGEFLLLHDAQARAETTSRAASARWQQAETCFKRSIEVARQQDAKALELRATVSLCRLWQKLGRREPARQMLVGVYDWFSEGFSTSDLNEARSLLAALS